MSIDTRFIYPPKIHAQVQKNSIVTSFHWYKNEVTRDSLKTSQEAIHKERYPDILSCK